AVTQGLVRGAIHGEEAAAAVEDGEVARLEMLPAALAYPGREDCVEERAAGRREHEAALARPEAPQPFAGAREIRPSRTAALRAEVVGHASPGHVGEPCLEIGGTPPAS